MPQIGDVVKASSLPDKGEETGANQIGKTRDKYKNYVWVECPDCEEAHWATKKRLESNTKRLCRTCTIKRAGKFSVTNHNKT